MNLELFFLFFFIGKVSFQIYNKAGNPKHRTKYIQNKPKTRDINCMIYNIKNYSDCPNNRTHTIENHRYTACFFHAITLLCQIQGYQFCYCFFFKYTL